jgi:hypothetical protein
MWTPENKVELGFYHQPGWAGYAMSRQRAMKKGAPKGAPGLDGNR